MTGEPYATYLKRRITAPLGLSHTGPCPEPMRPPSHAVGYLLGTKAVPVAGSYPFDSEAFAAGELCSTAGDLATWIDDLAHGRVVSAKTFEPQRRRLQQHHLQNGPGRSRATSDRGRHRARVPEVDHSGLAPSPAVACASSGVKLMTSD